MELQVGSREALQQIMLARYYASSVGRFLRVDPGDDTDPEKPQSWNKFSYVRNEPMRHQDPRGTFGILDNDGYPQYVNLPDNGGFDLSILLILMGKMAGLLYGNYYGGGYTGGELGGNEFDVEAVSDIDATAKEHDALYRACENTSDPGQCKKLGDLGLMGKWYSDDTQDPYQFYEKLKGIGGIAIKSGAQAYWDLFNQPQYSPCGCIAPCPRIWWGDPKPKPGGGESGGSSGNDKK